ncbi:hypothetical protein L7F22_054472 [Adiantum nelumboides]|nr:hypothetical protein [Adiantum nelumboides]
MEDSERAKISAKNSKKALKRTVSRDNLLCSNGNDSVTGITEVQSMPSLKVKKRKRKHGDVKDEIEQNVQLEHSTRKKKGKSYSESGTMSLEQGSMEGQNKKMSAANGNVEEEKRESNKDDTSWVQRASWKSLVGETGRVAFSLGTVLGKVDFSVSSFEQPLTEVHLSNDVSAWINGTSSSPSLKPNHHSEPAHVWKKSSTSKNVCSQDVIGHSFQQCVGTDEEPERGNTERPEHKQVSQSLKENGVEKVCTFMRSENYEQEWLEAKRAVKEIFKRTRKDALRSIKMFHTRQIT